MSVPYCCGLLVVARSVDRFFLRSSLWRGVFRRGLLVCVSCGVSELWHVDAVECGYEFCCLGDGVVV